MMDELNAIRLLREVIRQIQYSSQNFRLFGQWLESSKDLRQRGCETMKRNIAGKTGNKVLDTYKIYFFINNSVSLPWNMELRLWIDINIQDQRIPLDMC